MIETIDWNGCGMLDTWELIQCVTVTKHEVKTWQQKYLIGKFQKKKKIENY